MGLVLQQGLASVSMSTNHYAASRGNLRCTERAASISEQEEWNEAILETISSYLKARVNTNI